RDLGLGERLLVLADRVVLTLLGSVEDAGGVRTGQCILERHPAPVHGCGSGTRLVDLVAVGLGEASQLLGELVALFAVPPERRSGGGIFGLELVGPLGEAVLAVLEGLDQVLG